MKKQNIIILVVSILSAGWLFNAWEPILFLLGIIGFGFLSAFKYKHLWKDAENLFRSMSIRELFKDLKNKKKEK